jgi:hypothetical protein
MQTSNSISDVSVGFLAEATKLWLETEKPSETKRLENLKKRQQQRDEAAGKAATA